MDYATNFAILENGVVVNIAWGMVYEERNDVVPFHSLPVQIGDRYENGTFYRGEEPIEDRTDDMENALRILGVEA